MALEPAGEVIPSEKKKIAPRITPGLYLVFFIMLMDVIGITILIPVTPFIVARYSSDALMVTLVTVIYAAAQFFAAPLLGKLSDRYGRRPVLIISVFGSAVGYVIFGVAQALWVLLFSRVIDGITAGNMSTASAYIADVSRPEERARNFSLIGIAWGVGLILGLALGSVFSSFSLEAPAFVAAALMFLAAILGFFLLPESLPPERRETTPLRPNDINPFVSIGTMARKPGLGILLVGLSLFNFAFNGVNSVQGLFMLQKFEATPSDVGVMLVLVGIAVIVVQFALVQPLVARYGEKFIAMLSLFGLAIGYGVTFFMPALSLFMALTVLNNGISAFTFPTLTTLCANRTQPQEQGLLMGVTTALNSLMTILGPLWAGIVYDRVMFGSPYWMGAVIFAAAAFLLMRVTAVKVPETAVTHG